MSASVGLIALWTGELCANVEHMKRMSIHQMTDAELDLFDTYVKAAGYSISAIAKYVTEQQEQS